MGNIERNNDVRIWISGLAPHYQQNQPYQPRSNGRPAALIWVTVLTALVILIGATQSTVSALESNHTSMNSEALVQVTIPALVKIILMDAVIPHCPVVPLAEA